MDPNATVVQILLRLQKATALAAQGENDEAREEWQDIFYDVEAMQEWVSKGGDLPTRTFLVAPNA